VKLKKIKKLIGQELDWEVAKLLDIDWYDFCNQWRRHSDYRFSENGEHSRNIIETNLICVDAGDGSYEGDHKWSAHLACQAPILLDEEEITGPTMLIAAMRAWVAFCHRKQQRRKTRAKTLS
jgi:hypothetical protein